MGNAAVKEFKEATIEDGNILPEKCMSSKLISTETLTILAKIKGISKTTSYETEEGVVYATSKSTTFGGKSTFSDAEGNLLVVVKVKQGIKSDTSSIFRATPSFEGQAAIPEKETEDGAALYLFAMIKTKKSLTTASSTYSIVTGEEDGEPVLETLMTSKKLSAVAFYAEVKTADDVLIAKAALTGKFSSTGKVEMSAGVDILGVAIVAQSVSPGGSASAGGLAGAGVV